MGKLQAQYEVSIWKDIWQEGKFVEQRVCIIGSNEMTHQGRVLEPTLTQNTNGQKQFSFQMYTEYKDNITGENVHNIFCDLLSNETKVKLYYKNKWYDFYVKNITKNLSNHSQTYGLEDALVQELAKNGYDFAFDEYNNIGSAKALGQKALAGTGWTVDSEALTEMVEEHFVYVTIPKNTIITKINKGIDKNQGVTSGEKVELTSDSVVLAFYSSCTTKPARFQFVYLPDNQTYSNIPKDDKQLIDTQDNQFYYDVSNPMDDYYQYPDTNFYIPNKWSLSTSQEEKLYLSLLYRGGRYGYSILTEYLPKLSRYCNRYTVEGKDCYGHMESEYISPALATNFVTNSEFKDTSGWSGGYHGSPNKKNQFSPTLTSEFGEFDEGTNLFVPVIDQLKTGTFELKDSFKSYLRAVFPKRTENEYGYIINSGFYDNRSQLGSIQPNEEWVLYLQIFNTYGQQIGLDKFDIGICEVKYDAYSDYNTLIPLTSIAREIEGGVILTFNNIEKAITKEILSNANCKLIITPNELSVDASTTYYISQAELFKAYYSEDGNLLPLNQLSTEGIVNNKYILFTKEAYEAATSQEDLESTIIAEKDFNYTKYQPQYAEGCERIRSLEVAKSNYFNILQSIAETFECWVELEVQNRAIDGGITQDSIKVAKFKNYTGEKNYAPLRHGLNISDISRTFESKQIVTKLIVEPSVNDLAKDGYCAISRAPNNPTGEDTIYDFQYFFSNDLMNQRDYESTVFYATNPVTGIKEHGPDIKANDTETNIQNYYNRIKALNVKLKPINETIKTLSQDISKLKATCATEEKLVEAAKEGIENTKDSIYALTGTAPELVSWTAWDNVRCDVDTPDVCLEELNNSMKFNVTLEEGDEEVDLSELDIDNPPSWKFNVSIIDNEFNDHVLTNQSIVATNEKWEYQARYTQYSFGRRYVLSGSIISEITQTVTFTPLTGNFSNCSMKVGSRAFNTPTSFRLQANTAYQIQVIGDHSSLDFFEGVGDLGFSCSRKIIKNPDQDFIIKESDFVLFNMMPTEVYVTPEITISKTEKDSEGKDIINNFIFSPKITCSIPSFQYTGECEYTLQIANLEDQSLLSYLTQYATYLKQLKQSENNLKETEETLNKKEEELKKANENQQSLIKLKQELHQLFYKTYSRFILEGTWKNDEYIDDSKYYTDALSVLYNSCYPQVAYDIKVVSLYGLEGYEAFKYQLGETAYVEDAEFFGTSNKIEVLITGQTEKLDDPSKDSLTVQNFKNQFQDLFQKITATVQQTEYKSGSYEKAVALAEGDEKTRTDFVQEGLSASDGSFSVAGQNSVIQDIEGITLTDTETQQQLKLTGAGILIGTNDFKTGLRVWDKIISPDGISASSLTTGTLKTSEISIMSGDDPTFRWDKFGISAFDMAWSGSRGNKPNPYQFVRFDKYGIYGIKSSSTEQINGTSWTPVGLSDINNKATFALTWDGLKVRGNENVEARIGRNNGNIISITKGTTNLLSVDNNGNLTMQGKITTAEGSIAGWKIQPNSITKGTLGTDGFHMYSNSTDDNKGTYFGNDNTDTHWALGIGEYFGVTMDGKMCASAGKIAGWDVSANSITKGRLTLNATDDIVLPSLHQKNSISPARIGVGLQVNQTATLNFGGTTQQIDFLDGYHTFAADIGEIAELAWISDFGGGDPDYAEDMFSRAQVYIENEGKRIVVLCPRPRDWDPGHDGDFEFGCTVTYTFGNESGPTFAVLDDGSLYATGANIGGTINAIGGRIGGETSGLNITKDGIGFYLEDSSTTSSINSTFINMEKIAVPKLTTNQLVFGNIFDIAALKVYSDSSPKQYLGMVKIIFPATEYEGSSNNEYYFIITSKGQIGMGYVYGEGNNKMLLVDKLIS